MLKFPRHLSSSLLGVACAAGVVAAGVPAFGQERSLGEFTVVGPNDRNARSLSALVSYSDLDLTTGAGRAGLRARVRRTADTLCTRLGEGHGGVLSCEDDAVRSTANQQRDVIARAMARYAAVPAGQPAVASVGSTAAEAGPAAGSFILTVRVAAAR